MNKRNIFGKFSKTKYQAYLPNFKEEKTQAFTTLAFTLVAFCIFGFFAINPTISTIIRLRKELSDSQFVDDKLQEKITNLSVLQQKYSVLESQLPFVYSAIPQTPIAPIFTAQIQAIADKSSVKISRLQVYQVELYTTKLIKKDSSFAFSIEVLGSLDNVSKFLSSLVNFERIIAIDTFSTTRAKDLEQNGIIQLNVRGRSYFKI